MARLKKMIVRNRLKYISMIVAVLGHLSPAEAQISQGGQPYSFSSTVIDSIDTRTMAALDVAALVAEDELEAAQGSPLPPRFGYAIKVSLGLGSAGTWTDLPNGDRLWRLRISAPGAYSINLLYDDFWLPAGGRFFIYNADHSILLGAFTSANNKEHGKFSTGLVRGDISILEYYEPASARGRGIIHLSRVVHGYRNIFGPTAAAGLGKSFRHGPVGFGVSDTCQNNVNCPVGAPWAEEKQSVVMILLDANSRHCSGAIVNNTRLDYTLYMLTAFHCIDVINWNEDISADEEADAEQWIVMFNYESPDCIDPNDDPIGPSVSGTTLRASNAATDFALLELSSIPPSSYDVYYAGWSNVGTTPDASVGIHHPHGDVKKISFEDDPATSVISFFYTILSNSHWNVIFDDGSVEPGSSGSPLFDTSHRIVGQLHGGTGRPFCSQSHNARYGKFSVSWDHGVTAATRLKDWLDPDTTGAETLGGMDGPPRVLSITLPNAPLQKAKVYAAGGSVTAGTGVTVEASGDVMFVAGGFAGGAVTLSPGFHAKAGSKFRAYIDPGLIPPPLSDPTGLIIANAGGELGDNPILYWDPVVNAESYKVFRRFQSGGWGNIGTSSVTLYTDFGAALDPTSPDLLEYYVTAVNPFDESDPSNTASALGYLLKEKPGIPTVYSLSPSYPNPFNPITTLRFGLPEDAEVTLVVYNLLGQEVVRLADGPLGAAYHQVVWDSRDASGRQVPTGVYLYRIIATGLDSGERFSQTRKMVLLK